MISITDIKRVDGGYQLGKLIACGLPARQSQSLLLTASGLTEPQAAEVMSCSKNNIKGLKQNLFFKTGSFSNAELIAKAFQNAYLRLASLMVAALIGITAPTVNDHNSIARTLRPRPGNQLRARGSFRPNNNNGIYWSPETNELLWG